MDYTVFKAKILTKSSIGVANASLFEILSDVIAGSICINGMIEMQKKQLD